MKILPFGDKFAVLMIVFLLMSLSSGFSPETRHENEYVPPAIWNIRTTSVYDSAIGYDHLMGVSVDTDAAILPQARFILPSVEEVESLKSALKSKLDEEARGWEQYFFLDTMRRSRFSRIGGNTPERGLILSNVRQLNSRKAFPASCDLSRVKYVVEDGQCKAIKETHYAGIISAFETQNVDMDRLVVSGNTDISKNLYSRREFKIFVDPNVQDRKSEINGFICADSGINRYQHQLTSQLNIVAIPKFNRGNEIDLTVSNKINEIVNEFNTMLYNISPLVLSYYSPKSKETEQFVFSKNLNLSVEGILFLNKASCDYSLESVGNADKGALEAVSEGWAVISFSFPSSPPKELVDFKRLEFFEKDSAR